MRSFSLTKHLLVLTVFTALPLIALSFVVVDRLVQAERESIRKNLIGSAQSLANSTSGEIEEVLVVARLIARSRLLLGGDLVEFQRQVFEILPFSPETELHLSGAEGQKILVMAKSGVVQASVEASQPLAWDVAQRALASGKPVVSDVVVDRGEPVVVIQVPIVREGAAKQVLSMRVSTKRFQKLLGDQNYPGDWIAGILDTKGNFAARIPGPERVGTPAAEGWRAAIARSREGLIENTILEGDAVVTAYSGTPQGWTVGVAVRKSMLDTPVFRTLWLLSILAGLSLLVSLLFAWMIGRRLAFGVGYLESKAEAMILGLPIAPVPTGVSNYDRLLRAFAEASSLLRESGEQRNAFEKSFVSSEAFLQAAIAVSDVSVYDWDILTDAVSSDPDFKRLWGLPEEARPTSADLVALIHPEDRLKVQEKISHALDPAGDGLFSAEFRILPEDKAGIRWIACRSRTRFVEGRPVSAVGAARDITRRQRREARLRRQQRELRDLADAMPQLVWSADPAGQIAYYNQKRAEYKAETDVADWQAIIHPEDIPPTHAAWQAALKAGAPYSMEHRLMRADGSYAWHLSRALPFRDSAGNLTKWVGTATDIDEHKRRERHIRVLMAEVNHRSKNILSVIQGVARLTSSSTTTLKEFQEKFAARLQGLAASQDLLVGQNWHGVDLMELARLQLGHYAGGEGDRVRISGPPVFIAAEASQSIGMALHELSTNAAKYGALQTPEGRVELTWSVEETPAGPDLIMTWTERNGPPVKPPKRRGFGTVVIERMLSERMRGKVELLFPVEGLRWWFRAPLANLTSEADAAGAL